MMDNDILSWPASQRASHYRELAARLRQMAELETVSRLRNQLLGLAEQYEELASNLRERRPRADAS